MGIVFPNPARVNLPSKLQNLKQPPDIPAKIANIAAEEAGDTGTIGSAAKIGRACIKIASAAESISKEIGDSVVSHLSAVIDTFKILTIFKNIKTIADNSKAKEGETKSEEAQRGLKIAGATTGIVIGGMAFVKLGDGLKLWKIADISKAMGITSIASGAARAALSFPVVFAAFEIVESTFTIAAASLKMHDINKKMKRAKERVGLWKPAGTDDTFKEIVAGKLTALPEKMKALATKAETIVEKTADNYKKARADYDKIKKNKKPGCAKLIRKCALKRAQIKLKSAARDHTKACEKFDAAEGAFNKLGTKLDRWKFIEKKFQKGELTPKDKDDLAAFKTAKEQKWKLKVKNITWDKVKEGLTLGMSVFLTLFLITTIVLAIVFPVVLPLGAILGLSICGLLIAVGFAAKHVFPKIMESECGKKAHKAVDVPELEPALTT